MSSAAGCNEATTHVEVIASTRHEAPGNAWVVESRAFDYVARNGSKPGWRVIVTPIAERSLTAASPYDESTPPKSVFGPNDLDRSKKADADYVKAKRMFASTFAVPDGSARTEIIAAIGAAADRIQSDSGATNRLLVILSTGFEQSSIVNMGDYGLDLARSSAHILAHLRQTGTLPNLRGVDVCMAGITSGLGDWTDLKRAREIERFWRRFFAASGARLISYGVSIETCPPFRTQ